MPTSMTTAPSFIQSPFNISAFPVPTTRMSAFLTFKRRQIVLERLCGPALNSLHADYCKELLHQTWTGMWLETAWVFQAFKSCLCLKKEIKREGQEEEGDTSAGRSGVLEWQQVTVAWFHTRRSCMGAPTILLRPITTTFLPDTETPAHMGSTSNISKHIWSQDLGPFLQGWEISSCVRNKTTYLYMDGSFILNHSNLSLTTIFTFYPFLVTFKAVEHLLNKFLFSLTSFLHQPHLFHHSWSSWDKKIPQSLPRNLKA